MSPDSRALFVDLTKPENPKEYPVTDLSKKLIEYVGLDVIRFRRNQQVAYRVVDQCRETYDKIIGTIDEIVLGPDEAVDYDKFTLYTDAVDALEEYLFKLLLTSGSETADYLATGNTIHDCIRGADTWAGNRTALRNIASEFTTKDKLLAMFKGDKKKTEIERGFVEAAHDDDVAFFTNLRTTIESHALVNGQTQAKYKLSPGVINLIKETVKAIGKLGGAIIQDGEATKRKTLSVQFLFILHGAMELVVGNPDTVGRNWQAHLKSQEVWTAAKLVANHLNLDDKQYEKRDNWAATYQHFLHVISHLPGVQVPRNWLELVKLSARVRRPYLSRAWAIVVLSKTLVDLFDGKGDGAFDNVEPLERTFDKGIKVFKQANMSWKEAVEYDWATYDTQPAVLAFRELENEIKDRYTMLKAADQWPKALDILHKATDKDKERVEKMNERFKKVHADEHTTVDGQLINVTIKSSVKDVSDIKMQVSHTTRLSAIRYSLSRQVAPETQRKKILNEGHFGNEHTLDKDIKTICAGRNSCELRFFLPS